VGFLTLAMAACSSTLMEPGHTEPGPPPPPPSDSSGPTWRDLGAIPGVTSGSSLVVVGADVLAGTADGIWRHPLATDGTWQRSGLDGLDVRVLRTVPDRTDVVLAGGDPGSGGSLLPFYVSTDGGQTWTGSGEGLFGSFEQRYIPMADLAVQPVSDGSMDPVLYAAMSGTSIARSRDLGRTWQYVKGIAGIYAGFDCHVYILPSAPNTLYQGCESPLDDAWVDTYDVSAPDDSTLGTRTRVVSGDLDTGIGNRRPNGFASSPADPNTVYVGLEGGLITIRGSEWRWLWEASPSSPSPQGGDYTYVRAIWIDPRDTHHLLFGGGDSSSDSERDGLHETMDGGATVTIASGAPEGVDLSTAAVMAGVPAGETSGEAEEFVMLVREGGELHVLVREEQ
jgi:hypothetical protein